MTEVRDTTPASQRSEPQRWVDCFPWLESLAQANPWIVEYTIGGTAYRARRAQHLAELVFGERGSAPLAQSLGTAISPSLQQTMLSTRAGATLDAYRHRTGHRWEALTPAELQGLPGIDGRAARDLVSKLILEVSGVSSKQPGARPGAHAQPRKSAPRVRGASGSSAAGGVTRFSGSLIIEMGNLSRMLRRALPYQNAQVLDYAITTRIAAGGRSAIESGPASHHKMLGKVRSLALVRPRIRESILMLEGIADPIANRSDLVHRFSTLGVPSGYGKFSTLEMLIALSERVESHGDWLFVDSLDAAMESFRAAGDTSGAERNPRTWRTWCGGHFPNGSTWDATVATEWVGACARGPLRIAEEATLSGSSVPASKAPPHAVAPVVSTVHAATSTTAGSAMVPSVGEVASTSAQSNPEEVPEPTHYGDRLVAFEVTAACESANGRALVARDGTEPSFICIVPGKGVVVLELAGDDDGSTRTVYVKLNRKLAELEIDRVLPAAMPVTKTVAFERLEAATARAGAVLRVSVDELLEGTWLHGVPDVEFGTADVEQAVSALRPAFEFHSTQHTIDDRDVATRRKLRVVLDAEQQSAACVESVDKLLIDGPPGSGKTLVLVARARWLASNHSDWKIAIVCYNRALVSALKDLVAEYPNVSVSTVGRFAQSFGIRIDFASDDNFERTLSKAVPIVSERPDAILVDEVQDMRLSWLNWLHSMVRPKRGGLVAAGDDRQTLYHDDQQGVLIRDWFGDSTIHLLRPYRSTRQILAVASALTGNAIAVDDSVPEGPPVDVIYATTWDDQAAAIGWEVDHLLRTGERTPGDIGILVTRKSGGPRVARELARRSIPARLYSRDNTDTFRRGTDHVSIMTVHAAKGHEFEVVYVFGVDVLPDEIDQDAADSDEAAAKLHQLNIGLVGATRAKDRLALTYSKRPARIARLDQVHSCVRRVVWPDDYPDAGG